LLNEAVLEKERVMVAHLCGFFTEKQQKLAIFNKLLILISLNISGLNFFTAKIGQ
jgi:hypothetical protein